MTKLQMLLTAVITAGGVYFGAPEVVVDVILKLVFVILHQTGSSLGSFLELGSQFELAQLSLSNLSFVN